MKLEDFVYETLRGISIGVTKAKHDVGVLTAIAPGKLNGEPQNVVSNVSFDVAVTAAETENNKGSTGAKANVSLKVIAADVSLGGQGGLEKSKAQENSRVSRVTFSVPITLTAGTTMSDERTKAEIQKQAAHIKSLEGQE